MNRTVRLSAYRALALKAKGTITSDDIAYALGMGAPSMVRRDLSEIGVRGQRGVGYVATELADRVSREVSEDDVLEEAQRAQKIGRLLMNSIGGR